MAGSFCHVLASLLLLATSILLLVASISAPVVNNIGILTVRLPADVQGDAITFGTFGYCIEHGRDNYDDLCVRARLGYSPLDVARALNLVTTTTYLRTTTHALTRVMILHPIAAALSGLGCIFALAIPALTTWPACLLSTAAFVIVALVMVSDFVLFGMVRAAVNQDGTPGSDARFGAAMWCVLIAALCALVATSLVLGACCVGRSRRRRRRDAEKAWEPAVVSADAADAPTDAPTDAPAEVAPEVAPEMAPADGAADGTADGTAKPKRRFWKRG